MLGFGRKTGKGSKKRKVGRGGISLGLGKCSLSSVGDCAKEENGCVKVWFAIPEGD